MASYSGKHIVINMLLWLLAFFCVGYTIYLGYFMIMPRVTIANDSGVALSSARVQLPDRQLSFDAVAPGQESTLYHGPVAMAGAYFYQVQLPSGEEHQSSCGNIKANALFLHMKIRLGADNQISCHDLSL